MSTKVIEILNESLSYKYYDYIDSVVYVMRVYSDVVDVIILSEGPFEKEIAWIDFLESAKIIYNKKRIEDYKTICDTYIYHTAKHILEGT